MGTGFLTSLFQTLWCSALQPACQAFLDALRLAVSRPHATAPLEQRCGLPVIMVWRPLPVVGKLDHTMPRGPTCLVPSCAGLPDVQARYLEPVQGSPFHSWTRSCASVAGGPVHVWACPLILDGGPVRPSVLLWKPVAASAVCWLGCPRGTPAKCQVPILPTVLPRSLSPGGRLLLLLLAAAHVVAHDAVVPADTGRGCFPCHCAAPMPCRPAWEVAASPPLAIGGHLDLAELAGAALHLPAAASQLSLPHQTTLALVTVLDYG